MVPPQSITSCAEDVQSTSDAEDDEEEELADFGEIEVTLEDSGVYFLDQNMKNEG